jgi:hypothetical protein
LVSSLELESPGDPGTGAASLITAVSPAKSSGASSQPPVRPVQFMATADQLRARQLPIVEEGRAPPLLSSSTDLHASPPRRRSADASTLRGSAPAACSHQSSRSEIGGEVALRGRGRRGGGGVLSRQDDSLPDAEWIRWPATHEWGWVSGH